ncbi:hypothetical protein MJH12_00980, partial [bacterium]|nr:hypothetical protein [bacterium]
NNSIKTTEMKNPLRKIKLSGERVAIVAIIAVFSIPLVAITAPFLLAFFAMFSSSLYLMAPFLYIGASILGVKYLMGVSHRHKLELQQKRIELEKLELQHLQAAEKLLETPEDK